MFAIFVITLIFSLGYGLYLVWNPSEFNDTSAKIVASSVIIVFASLFYTAVCDAWFRMFKKND